MSSPSPKKKLEYLGDFTAGEMKLLMASVLCTPGKLDTDKLGKLTNMKRNSAASRFPSVKRKLEKMFEDQLDTLGEQIEAAGKDKLTPKSRAKKRRDKVVESQPKPEPEIKTEAKSEESPETPEKIEIDDESEEEEDLVQLKKDLVNIKADLVDIKPEPIGIKPEPID
ncbi:hypothetical protein N7491_002425 [Penicillium cf. griseofulvum]|uniref:Uncharacterized protein n=1 Tax=Penicillium cf. griseofulvum TaxID=2972120 RepID=A0A9W9T349_9EURO|nr:hypothetical protein N7472_003393 [Penicillium cf. griseofulvum]KAJ5446343.1 hypothetical protein N7491_002425 [Penicillium cf. griseofulvum]KAJ5448085.1 hypothetical protein N7445_002906 [Penicillium cf. griseofulvum]